MSGQRPAFSDQRWTGIPGEDRGLRRWARISARLRPRRFEPRGFTGECLDEPKGINQLTVAILLVAMATHVFSCQRPLRILGASPIRRASLVVLLGGA